MQLRSNRPALDDAALGLLQRGVWMLCIGIYLTVFIGGIAAGAAELMTLARAVAFTLAAAVLGRIALGLLARSSLAAEKGPTADQDGKVGSLIDLASSTNVAEQEDVDEVEAARDEG
jgi:hypothetical protein